MSIIRPESEQATEKVRQFNVDMSAEEFLSQWDLGFSPTLGHALQDLGDKPAVQKGDVKSYATGLPDPNDTLKITIV